jgi:protein TonB
VEIEACEHLIIKRTTMTNKEILRADILDILFEKRNKDYGAYALRRGYDKRLLISLGTALMAIALFALLMLFNSNRNITSPVSTKNAEVELTEIIIPKEKPKEIEKQVEQPKQKSKTISKATKPVSTEKFTSKIEIKPDNKVKEPLPPVENLENKQIGDEKKKGEPLAKIPVEKKPMEADSVGSTGKTEGSNSVFKPVEMDPQFPGGAEALRRFLASNLQTPSELEDGEKKTVLIRFKVDKDGSVNTFEIVTSGGNEFDREVVRVCKKMPRWVPAYQNGVNVPVSYVLPVTFLGVEP